MGRLHSFRYRYLHRAFSTRQKSVIRCCPANSSKTSAWRCDRHVSARTTLWARLYAVRILSLASFCEPSFKPSTQPTIFVALTLPVWDLFTIQREMSLFPAARHSTVQAATAAHTAVTENFETSNLSPRQLDGHLTRRIATLLQHASAVLLNHLRQRKALVFVQRF